MKRIKSIVSACDAWLRDLGWWQMFWLLVLYMLIGLLAEGLFLDAHQSGFEDMPAAVILVGALIEAPLLETFLCHVLLVELIMWFCKLIFKKRYPLFAIIVSAFVFSLLHHVNIPILFAVITLNLPVCYVFYSKRTHNRRCGFWMTALLHFIHNGVALSLNYLENGSFLPS